jgi:AmmeMemoRadiSam system radical SAM enzyme
MWQHLSTDSTCVVCDLCPRHCTIAPGQRGFCFVRTNRDGKIVSTTYGRSTGFCIDPIEKKPLHQFYPGTPVLSFGTAGCNLGCVFCQNWTSSRNRDVDAACAAAAPEVIAAAARRHGCRSVAFTYNDPIIWAEYAIDTAKACRALGVKTVAVTSGYITDTAREEFFESIDAANVDLKGFTDEFYREYCGGQLQPVLDTLRWLVRESPTWVEITNLVIPGANDSLEEIERMCQWIAAELGPDVPLHFSAFHPDFKLTDRGPTPPATLQAAYDIARRAGLRYVYVGNIHDPDRQHTHCPGCGRAVIRREGYSIGAFEIRGGRCAACQTPIAGHFDDAPGTWGNRRMPVMLSA